MERVISINKEVYNQPLDSPEKFKKMKIELYLPPSDIPQSIKPEYKEKEDILVIEFKYSDTEKGKELFDRENVKLIVGVYSGKLLRIEIKDIKREKINHVKLTNKISTDINRFIEEKVTKIKDLRERSNLSLAGIVLKQNAAKLASQV